MQVVTLVVMQATINCAAFIGLSGDFKKSFYQDPLFVSQYLLFTALTLYLLFWSELPGSQFFKVNLAPLLNVDQSHTDGGH